MDKRYALIINGFIHQLWVATPEAPFHPDLPWDQLPEMAPGLDWRDVTGLDPAPAERWHVDAAGDYHPPAKLSMAALTATLEAGYLIIDGQPVIIAADPYTFGFPVDDLGVALDVVRDDQDEIGLYVYTWDPGSEEKPDLPAGFELIRADVLRGILPAGAADLAEIQLEEVA